MFLLTSAACCGMSVLPSERPMSGKIQNAPPSVRSIEKMGLKIIESYDSSFVLEPDTKAALFGLLTSESFLKQVALQSASSRIEFAELLFAPVPYSSQTPKGMPAEFEKYHESIDFAIVNVPPNFMFQAKIFKPSRLCAVYRVFKN